MSSKQTGFGGIGRSSNLLTTVQSECWKERLVTEKSKQKKSTAEKIKELESLLEDPSKTSYLGLYKTQNKIMKQEEEKKVASDLTYDICKHEEVNQYCHKCKKDRHNCPHKAQKDHPKEAYPSPAVRSHDYGWGEPIDKYALGKQKNSVMIKNFYDSGHL